MRNEIFGLQILFNFAALHRTTWLSSARAGVGRLHAFGALLAIISASTADQHLQSAGGGEGLGAGQAERMLWLVKNALAGDGTAKALQFIVLIFE
jgi:hypothetical protein